MKKFIASLALCMLSAALYGGFGAMCAFAYMAVDDSQMEDVMVQTSPAFASFLHDSSRKSAEFTRQELQDGVAGFLFAFFVIVASFFHIVILDMLNFIIQLIICFAVIAMDIVSIWLYF